ncbi:influenza virus NS1A-binding protein like protein B [Ditylenchus destructor]|uniref:Influenza virus NS1A-binding protein like protein B n=1 Tax=Ditylenchus destructor TaxID=166010 RepID=A0AAD4N6Q5_9BILA|nr:influenza virus NS1A-binding protein like protein B [Ditylenchus destructor]
MYESIFPAVVGGCSEPDMHRDDVELADATVNNESRHLGKWRNATTNCEQGFSCAAFCQFKNFGGLIFGGYDGIESLNIVNFVQNNGTITPVKSTLPTRLKNSAAVPIDTDNKLSVLLFGGWDEKRTLNAIFEYSLQDESYEVIGILPVSLEGHTATLAPSSKYVIICGGFDGITVRDSLWKYDIATKQTVMLNEHLDVARENHAAVVLSETNVDGETVNYFVVLGGWDGSKALDDCEVFAMSDNEPFLVKVTNHVLKLTEPRNRPAALVL